MSLRLINFTVQRIKKAIIKNNYIILVPTLARHRRKIIILCKDYDIRRYKPTL
jgi:hypothetical protein